MSSNFLSSIYFLDQASKAEAALRKSELLADRPAQELAARRHDLQQVLPVEITFAHELSTQILTDVAKWLKTNVSECAVLVPKVDPKLLGGIVLSLKGKVKDYSVRENYERFWRHT